jgi:hypothetical protein
MALGYGMSGTTIHFPISPFLALQGEFDGPTDSLSADIFAVGDFNRRIVNNAHRQIYAVNDKFVVFDCEIFYSIDYLTKRIEHSNRN